MHFTHRQYALLGLVVCLLVPVSQAVAQSYAHFEARQTNPITLTPDGTRLLALNSPDGRLSVFDVTNASNPAPVLIAEIPVGLEPVSVRARTNDEVWVINEVGDSVSIISLSKGCVIASLQAPDEPADVAFANGKAFVSCARSNSIRVFDTSTRTLTATISLQGLYPRSLEVDTTGSKLYAAFQLSGNRTTTLARTEAPAQPAPTNTSLPAAPDTALIVPSTDPRVPYTVLDHDVVEINTQNNAVIRYFSDTGTNLFAIALHPSTGELWVANTEALNLTRFEPSLKGHFIDHRLSRIALPGAAVTVHDLNPGINYSLFPNTSALATSLAQPSALVFAADGTHGWVAAFNSDRVAKVSSSGAVLSRVDVRPVSANGTREMRGPRGLVMHGDGSRLFVLNKLSNSITTIATGTGTVLSEVPAGSYDPTPTNVKEGRGFLFDARLSGNGTMSCASCHLDADRDGLAWDLGDPGGSMVTVIGYNNSVHDTKARNRVMHPMKGPMVTQTMRGFETGQLFHWRGDRDSIEAFNVTYRDLMAGSLQTQADINLLTTYLSTLKHHPNPYRNLNRALPTSINGGNPNAGHSIYINHEKSHCITCHALPSGSDNNIDIMSEVGSAQPVKTPHLRTVYQRANFSRQTGAVNITGYGLLKDGTGFDLPIGHPYALADFDNNPAVAAQEQADLEAYVLGFDTGTAPSVGYSVTVTPANRNLSLVLNDLTTLEGQTASACNLIARGVVGGRARHYLFDNPSQKYLSDHSGEVPLTRAALLAMLSGDDALTFLGVLPGYGNRFSIDRNGNGTRNLQEGMPTLAAQSLGPTMRLQWPDPAHGWLLESSSDLLPPWLPVTLTRMQNPPLQQVDDSSAQPRRFYRLRRTW
jgi:YVTN family beta-propeller protein